VWGFYLGVRIPVVFIAPETSPGSYTGALGGPPLISDWLSREVSRFTYRLKSELPGVEVVTYIVKNPEEAKRVVEEERGSVGFVVVILHCWSGGATRVFLETGKPVILVAEAYGGGGEFLLEYGRAVSEGRPVVGISVRNLDSDIVLRKVKLLEVLQRLRETRVLFVTINTEWFKNIARVLKERLGVDSIIVDGRDFVERYYRSVDEREAERYASKWISEARSVLEDRVDEVFKSAKLYLAMKRALEDYKAQAIAVDCISLYDARVLDAWPCLGYMQLWLDGYVAVCEADPLSAITLLVAWYLAGKPGFISDPVLDQERGEVVYYHCYAPINMVKDKRSAYTITPAHLYLKRASVQVDLPVDEEITAALVNPLEKVMLLHRGRAVKNELCIHACATKLVAKSNVEALAKNWRYTWHRVVFYGDLVEDFRDLATLLGFKVVREDENAG
jgi:L-fucose isomerase-like protein